MFFTYTDEQIELIEAAHEAAKMFLEPTVKEDDEQEIFRPELLQQLGEAGMCGIPTSEEFEGYGKGYFEYALILEQIAKVSSSYGISVFCQRNGMLLRFSTRFLRPLKYRCYEDKCSSCHTLFVT